MHFLQLTREGEATPVGVNLHHIVTIDPLFSPEDGETIVGAYLGFHSGSELRVSETPEKIMKKLGAFG